MKFTAKPTRGSDRYLNLADGEKVVGIFRGEPMEYFVKWRNGSSTIVEEGAPGAKFKFQLNFLKKENGLWVAKIFKGGPTLYYDLMEMNEDYPLEETFVTIKRTGLGMKTRHKILPAKGVKWSAKLERTLKDVELQEIVVDVPETDIGDDFESDEDIE